MNEIILSDSTGNAGMVLTINGTLTMRAGTAGSLEWDGRIAIAPLTPPPPVDFIGSPDSDFAPIPKRVAVLPDGSEGADLLTETLREFGAALLVSGDGEEGGAFFAKYRKNAILHEMEVAILRTTDLQSLMPLLETFANSGRITPNPPDLAICLTVEDDLPGTVNDVFEADSQPDSTAVVGGFGDF